MEISDKNDAVFPVSYDEFLFPPPQSQGFGKAKSILSMKNVILSIVDAHAPWEN
jgi:hypothetical protein